MSGYYDVYEIQNQSNASNWFNITANRANSELGDKAETIISVLVSIFTVFSCSVISIVHVRNKELHTVSSFILLNSVLADLCSGVFSLSFSSWMLGKVLESDSLHDFLCKLAWTLDVFAKGWSAWAVFLVAIERYIAISNSMRQIITKRKAKNFVGLSIFLAVLFAVFPAAGWGLFEAGLRLLPPRQEKGICLLDRTVTGGRKAFFIYAVVFYCVQSLLPQASTVITLGLLSYLAWKVLRATERRNLSQFQSEQRSSTLLLLKSRGFKIIVAIIISGVIFVLPHLTVTLLMSTTPTTAHDRKVVKITAIVFSAHFAINSILYFFWLTSSRASWTPCLSFRQRLMQADSISSDGKNRGNIKAIERQRGSILQSLDVDKGNLLGTELSNCSYAVDPVKNDITEFHCFDGN
eukprot:m.281473 g.281473  ORF g.281473 m.281473 type:complete len:408 (+) comp40648_c0_seq2:565-1788(+)